MTFAQKPSLPTCSQEDAIREIRREVEALRELVAHLLVNNAGFATNGYFERLSPERDHDQVMVDVTSVGDLAHAFVPALLERSPGQPSSMWLPLPDFSPYPTWRSMAQVRLLCCPSHKL